jgi:dTDP-4-amino-4,6-dideoxygalactose transaminase
LLALKKDDSSKTEVIIPGYGCASIFYAVKSAGLLPKVADINPDTYGYDIDSLNKLINKKTLAVVVVHTFGIVDKIIDSLNTLPLLIEDCAHTFGCEYKNKKIGTFGDAAFMSFSTTKFLHTVYGGAVTSKNKKIIAIINDLKTTDSLNKKEEIGFNVSLSDVYATFGIAQLKKLKSNIKKRREIARIFDSAILKEFKVKRDYLSDSFYRYIIETRDNRQLERFEKFFRENGVYADRPISRPLFLLDKEKEYKGSKEVFEKTLAIPLYPNLKDKEIMSIKKIISKINERA